MNQINLDQKTHNCIQKESDESMTTQIKIQTKIGNLIDDGNRNILEEKVL